MDIISKKEQQKIYKDYVKKYYAKELKQTPNLNCEEFLREKRDIIGKILDNGEIEKEYYGQGYIYKNLPNYCSKKGICYISEFQGVQKSIPYLDNKGKIRKNEFGEELYYDTYYINENAIEGKDFETYNSLRKLTVDTFNENNIDFSNSTIELFENTLFDMVDWQFASSLADELIESWEE